MESGEYGINRLAITTFDERLTQLSPGQRLLLRPQQGRPGVLRRGLCRVRGLSHLPLRVSGINP
jgi:hypothetical protein